MIYYIDYLRFILDVNFEKGTLPLNRVPDN